MRIQLSKSYFCVFPWQLRQTTMTNPKQTSKINHIESIVTDLKRYLELWLGHLAALVYIQGGECVPDGLQQLGSQGHRAACVTPSLSVWAAEGSAAPRGGWATTRPRDAVSHRIINPKIMQSGECLYFHVFPRVVKIIKQWYITVFVWKALRVATPTQH